MEKQSSVIKVNGIPIVVAGFNWSVGEMMEKFIKSLANKQIFAAKCPGCGYTYCPPRRRCGKCNAKIGEENMIEVPGTGVLIAHTLAKVKLDGKGNFIDLEKPQIIGAVKLDKTDSTIYFPIEGAKDEEIRPGAKVAVQWAGELKGKLDDIKCFRIQ